VCAPVMLVVTSENRNISSCECLMYTGSFYTNM